MYPTYWTKCQGTVWCLVATSQVTVKPLQRSRKNISEKKQTLQHVAHEILHAKIVFMSLLYSR